MSETGYSLKEIADFLDAELFGDPSLKIVGICSLNNPIKDHITFVSEQKKEHLIKDTKASAIIVSKEIDNDLHKNLLQVNDPYLAYAKVTQLFFNSNDIPYGNDFYSDKSARISDTAQVGSNAHIGQDSEIGDNVCIGPNVFIGDNCIIQKNTTIHSNVSIYSNVSIGENCIIHSNSVLGSDGFGFAKSNGKYVKIHQLGGLLIGNDVEVGAACCVDRGAIDNTVISNGVKLDNNIHIAHNVIIGENSAIAASCAIAGSTIIGKNFQMGGLSGVIGHLKICDDVFVGAHTLITKSIKEPGEYVGIMPAQSHSEWAKSSVFIKKKGKK